MSCKHRKRQPPLIVSVECVSDAPGWCIRHNVEQQTFHPPDQRALTADVTAYLPLLAHKQTCRQIVLFFLMLFFLETYLNIISQTLLKAGLFVHMAFIEIMSD